MCPAVAALMRPVGEAPVLASPPAAVLADPAVALVPRVVAPVAPVVPEDSAVGRVVVVVVADADDNALPRLRGRRAPYPSSSLQVTGSQPELSLMPARKNFCGSTASPSIRVS